MSEEKQSILGKFGNIFVKDVPDEPDPKGLPPLASAPQPAVAATFPSTRSVDPALAKRLDDAASTQLSGSMEKVAGSYGEFLANMEVLAEAVPDEGLRLKAALKMLAKKGVVPSKVLSDADACLGALEEENRTFKAATQDQIDQKVGSKRKTVEQLKAAQASKRAQIVALEADISSLNDQQAALAADIKAEEDNIIVVQDRFSYVFTSMRASLTSQRAHIAAQGT